MNEVMNGVQLMGHKELTKDYFLDPKGWIIKHKSQTQNLSSPAQLQ